MEIFSEIWVWLVAALGGVSITGIISAVIYGCLKGAFNKTISKINVEKIAQDATEKGVEKVKKISFTHSIQPLVESELKKINEQSVEVLKQSLADVTTQYNKVILILEKLSAYFDNSIGVSDNAKEELKQAISEAKNEPLQAESVVDDEIVEPTPKQAVEPKESAKTSNIER